MLADTPIPQIEDKFEKLTKREDIAMVMINQWVTGLKPTESVFVALHLATFHLLCAAPCFHITTYFHYPQCMLVG